MPFFRSRRSNNSLNKNVGLVLDCFHFHAMNSRIEDLQAADPKKIFIFHIDDSEDLPVGALRDSQFTLMPIGRGFYSNISLTEIPAANYYPAETVG